MKIACIYADPKKKLSAWLTQWWTGSNCYHVAFVSDDLQWCWDMNKLARKVPWPGHWSAQDVVLVDCPFEVSPEDMDRETFERLAGFCEWKNGLASVLNYCYGFRDYLAFILRPLYHAFGKSTRNYGGEICSEYLATIGFERGWGGFDHLGGEVPSPADWCQVLGTPLVLETAT